MSIACGTSADLYRPFTGLSGINNSTNAVSSSYNALQIGLTRYFGGLNGSVAYTYGHSIDEGSSGGYGSTEVINSYNLSQSTASSNFDERHILAVSLVYDIPLFVKPGLLHSVLGGWQISDLTASRPARPSASPTRSSRTMLAREMPFATSQGNGVQSYPDIVGNIHGPIAIRHPWWTAGA